MNETLFAISKDGQRRMQMSNCVKIYTDVIISNRNIDTFQLFKDIEKYKDIEYKSEMTLEESTFYWFIDDHNVELEGTNLVISLGHGRSSHTWRDLRGTLIQLSKYLTLKEGETLVIPMQMADEYDDFKECFIAKFVLKKGELISG